mmetsp:Transcript_16679/g.30221  ORF Transcript_16679/g.30221 Transcript_16679/m.30221 type:complete len:893 (+) Transcript_16679:74-2752(+)
MLQQVQRQRGVPVILAVAVACQLLAGVQGVVHSSEHLRNTVHDHKAFAKETRRLRSTHTQEVAAGLRAAVQRRAHEAASLGQAADAEEATLMSKLRAAEKRAAAAETSHAALMAELKAAQQNAAHETAQNGQLAKKLAAASQNAAESTRSLAAVQNRMNAEKAAALAKLQSASNAKLQAEEGKERALVAKVETLEAARAKVSAEMTSWQKSAQAEAVATRHDRLGLLSEISELQEDLQTAKHQEELSRSRLVQLQKQAQQKLQEEESSSKMREQQRLEQVRSLQAEATAIQSNLTFETSQNKKLQAQAAQDSAMLADAKSRVLAADSENSDLQAAKDAAQAAEAAASKEAKAEASALSEAQRQLGHEERSFQAVKSELNAAQAKEAGLETARAQLQAHLAELQKESAASQAAKDKQMHDTMLAAAAKVRDFEDRAEGLESQLHSKQQELDKVTAELEQQQAAMHKEREAALQANRQVASLLSSSSKAAKMANSSAAHETQLLRQISALQEDHSNLVSQLSYLQQQNQQSSSEVDAVRSKADEMQKAAAAAKAENKDLKDKLTGLQDVAQSMRTLEGELQETQAEARVNASRTRSMQAELVRLRELEEHYSSDDDGLRKDVQDARAHSASLESQLREIQSNQQAAVHERDNALEQIKAMGGQEDEYFQENTQLRQQNEDVLAKYEESEAAKNRSRAEVQELKEKISAMQVEDTRREDHYNRAVVAAQAAAASIKKSFLATKAELVKTEQALQDAVAQQLVRNATRRANLTAKHLKQAAPHAEHLSSVRTNRSNAASLPLARKQGHNGTSAVPKQGHLREELHSQKAFLQHPAPEAAFMPPLAGNHPAAATKPHHANSTGLVQVAAQPASAHSNGMAKSSRNPLKELMALFTAS